MSDRFRELVEQNIGCVVILAGSGSDETHATKLSRGDGKKTKGLQHYAIPHEVRVHSAHNNPGRVLEIVGEYDRLQGSLVYITVAGGVDALSGIVSRHTYRPVISCPPDALSMAPNMSCLANPFLSSNLYVTRPDNAARAIAQMFSLLNPIYRQRLQQEISAKDAELIQEDERIRQLLRWCPTEEMKQ
ncbi:MAG: AIR carboxylase family protein [Candidatus Woesearchaeota archaeon]|nr:AIR carboxylase family protein [Candidatus Woesearchaeota archaeon]